MGQSSPIVVRDMGQQLPPELMPAGSEGSSPFLVVIPALQAQQGKQHDGVGRPAPLTLPGHDGVGLGDKSRRDIPLVMPAM